MRILVVISSYGSQNDVYLERVLAEYLSVPHKVDIVVLSNIQKNLDPEVEVRVGLPTRDPKSLPFGHRKVFAEKCNDYDLFVYSEDDILLTADNIEAFLEQSTVLPIDQVPGFLRFEKRPTGEIQYCDMHAGFCWDGKSVQTIAGFTFAYFSNEHAGCYILTRQQLHRVIGSGGFLVEPHEGSYGMLECAATDVYTQCGLKKMICISDLKRSSVHHLPNKYLDMFGLTECDLRAQTDALLQIERDGGNYVPLIQLEGRLKGFKYLRDHYEPARTEVLSLIPENARSVLSFGCGKTEIALARRGIRVLAVPVDPVVSAAASGQGVELVSGDFESIMAQLQGQTFDYLLFINVLHLVKDPFRLISSLMQFLGKDGVAVVLAPYLSGVLSLIGWLTRKEGRKSYREAGVNITSPGVVRKWLRRAGVAPGEPHYLYPRESRLSGGPLLKFLSRFFANEFVLVARSKAGPNTE